MKTIILAITVLLAANTTSFAQGKTTKTPKHKTTAAKYTCEMHPEVVTSKPGKCTKCGMKLVKVTANKPMKDSANMKDMKM